MTRFFDEIHKLDVGAVFAIQPEHARHVSKVLRMRVGEAMILCDGAGGDYTAEITSVKNDNVEVKIIAYTENTAESLTKITLYQSLPKLDKLEMIVQKCVEVGVWEIIPVSSEHSVPATINSQRLERLRKISESAACQSGRGIIPQIHTVTALKNILPDDFDEGFVAYEKEHEYRLKQDDLPKGGRIGLFIGPEGGFSANEIKLLLGKGVRPFSLGRRILRTETAGIAALAVLFHETEA